MTGVDPLLNLLGYLQESDTIMVTNVCGEKFQDDYPESIEITPDSTLEDEYIAEYTVYPDCNDVAAITKVESLLRVFNNQIPLLWKMSDDSLLPSVLPGMSNPFQSRR